MLVLSRKVGEGVQIGDQITVTIVRIAGGGVRIGVAEWVASPLKRLNSAQTRKRSLTAN